MASPDSSDSRDARPRLAWLPALAALVVVAAASALGAWQLSRADEKRAVQAQRDAARTAPAIALDAQSRDAAALDGLRVRVRGRYWAEHTVYIDNRTLRGVAGFHVVTPIRIEGAQHSVLVLRGWIAGDPRERARLPQVRTPAGIVDVEGVAQAAIEQTLELAGDTGTGDGRLWQNLDFERFERWSGLALVRLLIRESDAAAPGHAGDGLAREWPIGGPDASRHVGYALQWFALALLVAAAWIYFALRRSDEPRPRT
ncbi:MAG: SURF1 family protein [Burkholderiaceae bacterium]|nr:SURF1 family protein [Burkholderiaceae bacterium]